MQKLIQDQKEKEDQMLRETGAKHILLSRAQIKEIRTAETVVKTAIHPDTGEFIPWTMRLSSFVPMNLPISFGMIITAPTPFNTIFWQWINQSYNAILNYGNRNASSNYTTNDIMKSYGYACASSITVALGIRKMLSGRTKNMTGAKLIVFNSISAFFACSTAGFLNAYFMRQTELEKGISIVDPSNPEMVIGKSKAAAYEAVMQTAVSRYILCVPLFLPAACLYSIEKMKLMPRNFVFRTTLEMFLFFVELYVAVPLAIAYYPQFGKIKASDVEPEYQNLKNQQGEAIKEFQYNKGL